jgi:serine/threonine protein kinase
MEADAPGGLCPACRADHAPTPPPADSQQATCLPRPPVPDPVAAQPLQALFGDYELMGEIARGGMGVVYRARHTRLNRVVALKMILAGQLATEDDVQRFRIEAEAAAQLDHPHIVPIYEVGEAQGQQFFAMRLIDGGSLAQRMSEFHIALTTHEWRSRRPQTAQRRKDFRHKQMQSARLVAAVARAVHHAHERGILHRDLKPANILLDVQGQPHVTDLGLAKRVAGLPVRLFLEPPAPGQVPSPLLQAPDVGQTPAGAIVGTPSYMAPEQAAGKKGISTAADVYSLGAILFELLTGQPPFRASTQLDTLFQVLEKEPPRLRDLFPFVDPELEVICLKCLRKDPDQRFKSAEALAEELDRWLRNEPIHSRRIFPWTRLHKLVKRHPVATVLSILFVLVSTIGLRIAVSQWRKMQTALENREFDLYCLQLAAAERDWVVQEPERAREGLNNCNPQYRSWEWNYLNRTFYPKIATLPWGGLERNSLAFSPDGKRFAMAGTRVLLDNPRVPIRTSREYYVTMWETITGKKLQTFIAKLPARGPDHLQFATNGNRLALLYSQDSSHNQRAYVWDLHLGRVFDVGGKRFNWKSVFSPDLKLLAIMNPRLNHTWTIANVSNGKTLYTLVEPGTTVALSPDGNRLISHGKDQTKSVLKVWEMTTGKLIRELKGHAQPVTHVAFSPDSKLFATARMARNWWPGPKQVSQAVFMQTLGSPALMAAGFSQASVALQIAGLDASVLERGAGKIIIWDATTCRKISSIEGDAEAWDLAFGHDGKHVYSLERDKPGLIVLDRWWTFRVATSPGDRIRKSWDSATGKEISPPPPYDFGKPFSRINPAMVVKKGLLLTTVSPDGSRMAVVNILNQTVDILNLNKRKPFRGHLEPISDLAFSRGGLGRRRPKRKDLGRRNRPTASYAPQFQTGGSTGALLQQRAASRCG